MAPNSTKRRSYSAPALSKGLDILELMTAEPARLSLGQLAGRMGRTKSQIYRMLVVLTERGYVSLDRESDTYGITLKLFALTQKLPRIHRLSSAATPAMSQLSRTIEQSCHLVVEYEGKGVVVAQQDSPADRGFSVRLGAEAPLTNSCSGLVLLAFANPGRRQEMLKAVPPKLRTRRPELQRKIDRVSERGFELTDSAQVQGVKDIGFPVFDYTGEVAAALVVPFLEHLDGSHKIDFQRAREHLAKTAESVSEALGLRTSLAEPEVRDRK